MYNKRPSAREYRGKFPPNLIEERDENGAEKGRPGRRDEGGGPVMDYTALAVAAMSLLGTLAGTFGGILVSNKLTVYHHHDGVYRIEQLEQKVAAHNKIVERTYKLEGQMAEVQHGLRDLRAAV